MGVGAFKMNVPIFRVVGLIILISLSVYDADANDDITKKLHIAEIQNFFNLTGENELIGVWETFHAYDLTPDLMSRVTYGDNDTTTVGNNTYFFGDHATHVAGTLMGNGNLSGGAYAGIANNAQIVAYEKWDSQLEFEAEVGGALVNGIFIFQNSWGNFEQNIFGQDTHGDYTEESQWLDQYISLGYNESKGVMVYSAGNERPDDCDNGQFDCLTRQATAKNVIAVGAVETDNEGIYTDSSFGPTNDGRVKPDVAGYGCDSTGPGIPHRRVYSIWSSVPNLTIDIRNNANPEIESPDGIDDINSPTGYWGICGTSMAAPVVSGSIALIMQQFKRNFNLNPIPSTVKSILIHTADDIRNVNEFAGKIDPPDGPDFRTGYGLVNPRSAINVVRDADFFEGTLDETGNFSFLMHSLRNNNQPFKITLVWDDSPADPGAGKKLINDLDLIVSDPTGERKFPWTLDHNNPEIHGQAFRNQPDNINNVEQVFVFEGNVQGEWNITINATNITSAQNFSVVLEGFMDNNTPSSPVVWASPIKGGNNLSLFWKAAKDQETGIFEYQYQIDSTLESNWISTNRETQIFLDNLTEGNHTVYVRALDFRQNPSEPDSVSVFFDSTPLSISNVSANFIAPKSVTINWDTDENASGKVDYGTTASYGSVVEFDILRQHHSVALVGLSDSTTYHYRVSSVDQAGNNISSGDFTFTTTSDAVIQDIFSGTIPPLQSTSNSHSVTLDRPGRWVIDGSIPGHNVTIEVFDNTSTLFASKVGPSPERLVLFLDNDMTGSYSLQVSYSPVENASNGYSIDSNLFPWTEGYYYEYNDNFREAKGLELEQSYTSYLMAWNGSAKENMNGDHDYWIFNANKPGNYIVTVNSIPESIDGEITLYDSEGNVLASDSDPDSITVSHTMLPPDLGNYFLRFRDDSNNGWNNTDPYTINVSLNPSFNISGNHNWNDLEFELGGILSFEKGTNLSIFNSIVRWNSSIGVDGAMFFHNSSLNLTRTYMNDVHPSLAYDLLGREAQLTMEKSVVDGAERVNATSSIFTYYFAESFMRAITVSLRTFSLNTLIVNETDIVTTNETILESPRVELIRRSELDVLNGSLDASTLILQNADIVSTENFNISVNGSGNVIIEQSFMPNTALNITTNGTITLIDVEISGGFPIFITADKLILIDSFLQFGGNSILNINGLAMTDSDLLSHNEYSMFLPHADGFIIDHSTIMNITLNVTTTGNISVDDSFITDESVNASYAFFAPFVEFDDARLLTKHETDGSENFVGHELLINGSKIVIERSTLIVNSSSINGPNPGIIHAVTSMMNITGLNVSVENSEVLVQIKNLDTATIDDLSIADLSILGSDFVSVSGSDIEVKKVGGREEYLEGLTIAGDYFADWFSTNVETRDNLRIETQNKFSIVTSSIIGDDTTFSSGGLVSEDSSFLFEDVNMSVTGDFGLSDSSLIVVNDLNLSVVNASFAKIISSFVNASSIGAFNVSVVFEAEYVEVNDSDIEFNAGKNVFDINATAVNMVDSNVSLWFETSGFVSEVMNNLSMSVVNVSFNDTLINVSSVSTNGPSLALHAVEANILIFGDSIAVSDSSLVSFGRNLDTSQSIDLNRPVVLLNGQSLEFDNSLITAERVSGQEEQKSLLQLVSGNNILVNLSVINSTDDGIINSNDLKIVDSDADIGLLNLATSTFVIDDSAIVNDFSTLRMGESAISGTSFLVGEDVLWNVTNGNVSINLSNMSANPGQSGNISLVWNTSSITIENSSFSFNSAYTNISLESTGNITLLGVNVTAWYADAGFVLDMVEALNIKASSVVVNESFFNMSGVQTNGPSSTQHAVRAFIDLEGSTISTWWSELSTYARNQDTFNSLDLNIPRVVLNGSASTTVNMSTIKAERISGESSQESKIGIFGNDVLFGLSVINSTDGIEYGYSNLFGGESAVDPVVSADGSEFGNLTNVTTTVSANESGIVHRHWYGDVNVTSNSTAVADALVSVSRDPIGVYETKLTDANGLTRIVPLGQVYNSSGEFLLPTTIQVSKTGFEPFSTLRNVTDNFLLPVNLSLINPLNVTNFSVVFSNTTERVFKFFIVNIASFNIAGVNWSLDSGDGVTNSQFSTNLSVNKSLGVWMYHNYSTTGVFNVTATAFTENHTDAETIEVTV